VTTRHGNPAKSTGPTEVNALYNCIGKSPRSVHGYSIRVWTDSRNPQNCVEFRNQTQKNTCFSASRSIRYADTTGPARNPVQAAVPSFRVMTPSFSFVPRVSVRFPRINTIPSPSRRHWRNGSAF